MGRSSLTPSVRIAKGRPPKRVKEVGYLVPTEIPKPPEGMSSYALQEWHRLTKYLEAAKRVSSIDYASLAAYCHSWEAFSDSMRLLLSGGASLFDYIAHQDRKSVYVDIALKHGSLLLRICRRYGLTPASRSLTRPGSGKPAKVFKDPMSEVQFIADRLPDWDMTDVDTPEWFDDVAFDVWQRIVPQLTEARIFTPLDVVPMSMHCGFIALAFKAHSQLEYAAPNDKTGMAVEHPTSVTQRAAYEAAMAFWREFGLTPADRKRLVAPYVQDDDREAVFL